MARKARPATAPFHFDAPTRLKEDAKVEAIRNGESFTKLCTRAVMREVQRLRDARLAQNAQGA